MIPGITAGAAGAGAGPGTMTDLSAAMYNGGARRESFTGQLSPVGGVGPFSWAITSGALPTGLSMNSAGAISGTIDNAATLGANSFTARCTDSTSAQRSKVFIISVGIVVALLHLDGSNASTTITDPTGKTWTANGNAQLSTAQKQFGTAAALLDGTGDYLSTPAHSDYDFGSSDFTAEGWVRPASIAAGVKAIITNRASAGSDPGFFLAINNANLSAVCWGPAPGSAIGSASTTSNPLAANTWAHVVYQRRGPDFEVYVDGVLGANVGSSSAAMAASSNPLLVGQDPSTTPGRDWNGEIDEMRLTAHVARYAGNFTPPAAPSDWA